MIANANILNNKALAWTRYVDAPADLFAASYSGIFLLGSHAIIDMMSV